MKYIQKEKEPEEFIIWKQQETDDWKPNWGNFQEPEKGIVKSSLLEEQGYICCYCGNRIWNNKSTKIEHLFPRSKYPDKQIDYSNLLASCCGGQEDISINSSIGDTINSLSNQYSISKEDLKEKNPKINWQQLPPNTKLYIYKAKNPKELYCDAAKKETSILILPTNKDCESHFKYKSNGQIHPKTKEDSNSNKTIKALNLNCSTLVEIRKNTIHAVLELIQSNFIEDIQSVISIYKSKDDFVQGKNAFRPFCQVIYAFLEDMS